MKFKRTLASIFSCIMLASCVAVLTSSCGDEGGSGGTGGTGGGEEEPVTIRWFQDLRGIDPETDRVIAEIEKINNIKFDFVAAPGGSEEQDQKLNLMVSTGEQLDLVTMLSGIDTLRQQWVTDEVLLAFDDYIGDDHPNLNTIINAEIYNYLKIDGKSYFQAMPLAAGNRGYIIKQDWLDAVGLEHSYPISTNIYEVIKAFTYNDPDGNGKDDTYGFFVAEPYGSNAFGYIARAFINCGCWGGDWVELSDGTVTQFVASDEAAKHSVSSKSATMKAFSTRALSMKRTQKAKWKT